MDDLGIVDEILRLGRFHVPFRGYDGATVLGEKDFHEGRNPTPSTPYASPLLLPQWRVEETLRALLEREGAAVELATELVSLTQDEAGVTATLQSERGEESLRCRYLVAADGGRSFVRKFLEVPFEGETWKDERMYVGDVRLRGLDREAWHSWTEPSGWLAWAVSSAFDGYLSVAGPGACGREGGAFAGVVSTAGAGANGWDGDCADGRFLALAVSSQCEDGFAISYRPCFPCRRRSACAFARRWAGHEYGDSGRLQPRLEAGECAAGGAGEAAWIPTRRSVFRWRPACSD